MPTMVRPGHAISVKPNPNGPAAFFASLDKRKILAGGVAGHNVDYEEYRSKNHGNGNEQEPLRRGLEWA